MTENIQLALSALNVLIVPALYSIARWLMRVELRLARLEWASGRQEEEKA